MPTAIHSVLHRYGCVAATRTAARGPPWRSRAVGTRSQFASVTTSIRWRGRVGVRHRSRRPSAHAWHRSPRGRLLIAEIVTYPRKPIIRPVTGRRDAVLAFLTSSCAIEVARNDNDQATRQRSPDVIGRWLFRHPEGLLIVVAAQLLLGRYTGYRLTEPYRFRDVIEFESAALSRKAGSADGGDGRTLTPVPSPPKPGEGRRREVPV